MPHVCRSRDWVCGAQSGKPLEDDAAVAAAARPGGWYHRTGQPLLPPRITPVSAAAVGPAARASGAAAPATSGAADPSPPAAARGEAPVPPQQAQQLQPPQPVPRRLPPPTYEEATALSHLNPARQAARPALPVSGSAASGVHPAWLPARPTDRTSVHELGSHHHSALKHGRPSLHGLCWQHH